MNCQLQALCVPPSQPPSSPASCSPLPALGGADYSPAPANHRPGLRPIGSQHGRTLAPACQPPILGWLGAEQCLQPRAPGPGLGGLDTGLGLVCKHGQLAAGWLRGSYDKNPLSDFLQSLGRTLSSIPPTEGGTKASGSGAISARRRPEAAGRL